MEYLNDLKRRYEEKKERREFSDKEVQFLDTFLKDENCFLRVKADQAVGIIRSLGVDEDRITEYYRNILISSLIGMKSKQNVGK